VAGDGRRKLRNLWDWLPYNTVDTLLPSTVHKAVSHSIECSKELQEIAFFFFNLIFKLYIIVLVLPNIKMNPPQVYMCSLNMLSRLVITFLPRSKRLLISWLQSPSAVILEPKIIKSDTVSTVSPSISHEVMGPDAMILVF